jgi:hypothetical protein
VSVVTFRANRTRQRAPVEADDLVALVLERAYQRRAKMPGTTCYQDLHIRWIPERPNS